MERTISVTIGQGCLKHNNRVFIAENVDVARLDRNVIFLERDIRAVYHELFDDAVEEYNARQKRKDRKIQNYYEKIKSGRQERLFTEAIVQIGNMKDSNCAMEEADLVKGILTEYMQDFEERNPSLKVFNAVLHMDERHHTFILTLFHFPKGINVECQRGYLLKGAMKALGYRYRTKRHRKHALGAGRKGISRRTYEEPWVGLETAWNP